MVNRKSQQPDEMRNVSGLQLHPCSSGQRVGTEASTSELLQVTRSRRTSPTSITRINGTVLSGQRLCPRWASVSTEVYKFIGRDEFLEIP